MKKSLVSALACLILAGTVGMTHAQGSASSASLPHKVGLIDMAHVFQKYEKFKLLREGLKAEIDKSDAQAKSYMTRLQTIQGKLKELKQGSPDYVKYEKELLSVKSDFEAFRTGAQRDLMRRESKIYKQVYLETVAAVQQYCKYYKYTLVIRFNRKSVTETEAPGEIVQGMNRQVVYHQEQDDITEKILQFLNSSYKKQQARSGSPAPARTARN